MDNKQKNVKLHWCKEIMKIRIRKNGKKKICYQKNNFNSYILLKNREDEYCKIKLNYLDGKENYISLLLSQQKNCSFRLA